MIKLENLTKIFDTPSGPVTAADRVNMEAFRRSNFRRRD